MHATGKVQQLACEYSCLEAGLNQYRVPSKENGFVLSQRWFPQRYCRIITDLIVPALLIDQPNAHKVHGQHHFREGDSSASDNPRHQQRLKSRPPGQGRLRRTCNDRHRAFMGLHAVVSRSRNAPLGTICLLAWTWGRRPDVEAQRDMALFNPGNDCGNMMVVGIKLGRCLGMGRELCRIGNIPGKKGHIRTTGPSRFVN